ncbi:UBP31 hydrolase, partial [Polypterus senegalus]
MSKVTTKEKKSFSKKLFRRGSVRSVGSFMSRVLKTLSTLSHFGTEEHATDEEKDDGGFSSFTTGGRSSVKSDGDECQGFLFSGDRIPGVAGLKNHGNTCFMNAILQCLSNTDLFAEYLALEHYRGEEENDEQAKSNGVLFEKKTTLDRGEVTEQLGRLVRSLWTFEYTPQHSREFKSIVSKNALQYRGNAQHDAQEFLLWLLDCVHEDLNNFINPNGRPQIKPPLEEDAASEGPSLPVTSSFIQELFQAQYRPLYVTVVYQGKCSHCMRIGVAVPLSSKVSRLRDAVSMETKIPTDQVGPFSLRVVGVVGITYLLPQEEQPLCHPTVESLFGHTEDEYVPDSESVRQQREIHHQPQACTLTQCFQLYTKEEQARGLEILTGISPEPSVSTKASYLFDLEELLMLNDRVTAV